MIDAGLTWINSLDHRSLCVVVGLGCYVLVPFAWANEKANALIEAIRSLKK